MFHASLKRAQSQIIHAGFNERVQPFFEEIEERELVTAAGLMSNLDQRNRNRRRRRREIRNDFLVADCLEDVLHGFLKLGERDYVLVVSKMKVKRDAFSHVVGQPPARLAGFGRGAIEGGGKTIAVELEELTGVAAQIREFFFKRDHDSLDPAGTTHAALNPASARAREPESRPQIYRHRQNVDAPRRNADRPLHRFRAASPEPSRRLRPIELRGRRFPDRARFRPPAAPATTNSWNAFRKPWRCCRPVCAGRTVRGSDRASPPADPSVRFLRKS